MPPTPAELREPVLAWFGVHARDLPWRAPDRTAWAVLVSEVMLQQTPVTRVLPVFDVWLPLLACLPRRIWPPTPPPMPSGPGGGSGTRGGRCGCMRRRPRSPSIDTPAGWCRIGWRPTC